uniref:EB domain-containing protein n=1 Tax=Magallana gigas TaxID=29159 RepID=A0A8W8MAH4_MAGGI
MEIRFTSTSYKFPLKTLCSNGTIENFDIDLDCEGEYLHVHGIGERCVNASQCLSVNVNSTCNETIGLCQCKTGYQCLSGTSTRLPTPELGGQCNDSKQCKEVDQYSVCSRDNICKCNKGYTEISDYRLKEEKSDNSALVFGVGTAGFVLGVAVCGLLYIIMIRYRNRSQASRSDKRREDCTEKGSVLVSQTSTPHPNYNKTLGDNLEGIDVYNHLHEAPNEVSVQPDYDHVPPQVEENGDYSHITTRNAHSSDIAGEYGKIS